MPSGCIVKYDFTNAPHYPETHFRRLGDRAAAVLAPESLRYVKYVVVVDAIGAGSRINGSDQNVHNL
jgi:hypothetical protein